VHGADQERPRGAGGVDDTRLDSAELLSDLAVDQIVVLAAQPVVPDPSRVRHAGVDHCRRGLVIGSV